MSRSFVSEIELGEHGMNLGRLYTLARALGVRPADLVEIHNQMTIRISTMTGYCPTVTTDDDITAFLRTFGERLHRERQRRHLSQEDFAALIGLDRTFYGALERGERGCNIIRLPQLADALGLSLGELLPPAG